MKINRLMLFLASLMFFVQCDSPHFYQQQESTKNNWNKSDALNFDFVVKDSTGVYDIFLLSRNNNEYEYSNLYLFTEMKFPTGEVFTDTLQYFLAYQDGEWIGDGGKLKELFLLYRENISLKDTGKYELKVRHGMRDENLIGIEDISLIVDKVKSNEEAK